jgi:hypothetical protein
MAACNCDLSKNGLGGYQAGTSNGTMPTSEQMIPGRSPGMLKGTLARPGAQPPGPKRPNYKSKSGGSIKPGMNMGMGY